MTLAQGIAAHNVKIDAKLGAHIAKAHKKCLGNPGLASSERVIRGATKEAVWARPVRGSKAAAEEEAPEEKPKKKK